MLFTSNVLRPKKLQTKSWITEISGQKLGFFGFQARNIEKLEKIQ